MYISNTLTRPNCNKGQSSPAKIQDQARVSKNEPTDTVSFTGRDTNPVPSTNGSDSNTFYENGWTPTTWAAKDGNIPALRRLAEDGADLNLPNKNGFNPLTTAVASGQIESFKVLCELGANFEQPDANHKTPLDIAKQRRRYQAAQLIEQLIREKQATQNQPKSGISKQEQEDLNHILHAAIETGRLGAIEHLYRSGADLNAPGEDGKTPMRRAADKQNHEALAILISLGADPKTLTQPVDPNPNVNFRFEDLQINDPTRESTIVTGTDTESVLDESVLGKPSTASSTSSSSTIQPNRNPFRRTPTASVADTESLLNESVLGKPSTASSTSSRNTVRH